MNTRSKNKDDVRKVIDIISSSKWHMGVLHIVADLGLPDWWIGAGFVRNAVWDHLHGKPMTPRGDIDVIYFDRLRNAPDIDKNLEIELETRAPKKLWSVKNQARMHEKHGHDPYKSCFGALKHWPETATAVAITLGEKKQIALLAPYGVEDLLNLIVRPTYEDLAETAKKRAQEKRWVKTWNKLTFDF